MRQGVICMLIAALVLQLAGGVVAGGAEPLAMTTQETIRTVAVSGVPTALMRGARLPERMPSFHTDAACHLADSWQSWSGMVWFSSPDGEHISKPLPAGTVTEPGVYYYLGLVLEPDGLASFSDAPSVTVCGTTAAVQRLEDGRLFVCVRYGSDDGRLEGLLPETLPFRDVSRRAWYFESVAYAYRQGLMSGTGTTEFEPDTATSRAMLVQVLYRLAGQPAAAGSDFSDVGDGVWYADAVSWAAGAQIVNGYGNGRFGPDDPVTREQTAAILYRYAVWYDLAGDGEAPLSGYPDAGTVSSWARSAMGWAVGAGYLTGSAEDGAVLLRPQALAVRAQTAAILARFCRSLQKQEHIMPRADYFTARGTTVLYLPLDNRPVNDLRVEALADSTGMNVLLPPEDLYATRLDGQTTNANGTQYGDTHALLQWVLDNEDACDVLIVSMDQLLSGGLVNSRWEDGMDLTWEQDAIDTLSQIAARKPVYVFDTVMRLATTAGYQGLDSEAYRLFRSYGMAERGELTGHNLTVDNIIAGYPYGADGERIETTLDNELVEHYLAARARKLRLTDYLLRHAESFAACVVGVDDSAARISVQTNEIRYLQRLLGKNCALFCGTDELGMMAFTRAYADCAGWNSRLSVHYFGGYEDSVADAYDTSTLRESVEQHITALGAELVDWNEQSDAVVLVLTRGASSTECGRYLAAWEENCRNGVPTIVIDASSATQHLPQQLEDTSLQWLMGYSAWGTAANSVGIALSMGLTRLQWLQGEQDPQPEDSEAFARELIFAYMKDIAYCRYCRPTIKDLTPEGIEQALLRQNMTTRVETALKDTALVTGPDGVTDYVIPEFRLTDFSAPLGRSYEIRFRILFPNAGPWITEQ